MENLFLHYMFEKARREEEEIITEFGPVITLSREYGCYGSEIAQLLADKINHAKVYTEERDRWVFVSHQVLHDASTNMGTEPRDISHIFGAEEKSFFGDLVSLFSKDKYISDSHIKRTIARVVRSYSEQGKSIIVGRAGCVIAKHIEKAIHVKLIAPFEWRVSRIMERFSISHAEAESKVKETDKRRETFMKFFRGKKPDSELFDLILNRSTLSNEDIVNIIYFFAQNRGLV
ncbi:MAG TPA: cytidylate kinase-like family protein [Tenuifilaceae bacterium]|nr:cytidylate kinase-like family protein [Tenuifilaceae bacterium]HPE18583.1 cytidylate kinase-like family protein [Tenuifilaceae bacterium]HPJ46046.1 cytidylate kinase-like family protein [Tenuifilaceae bacterium]HPQ34749.1 cytidylate kinase-like family protein [Tenuifilaceae bacterium]HRX67378.1 cytidylate kinase-like family protein [Tenuifilaceae bacterium]